MDHSVQCSASGIMATSGISVHDMNTSESSYVEDEFTDVNTKGVRKPSVSTDPLSSYASGHEMDITEVPYVEDDFNDVHKKSDEKPMTMRDPRQKTGSGQAQQVEESEHKKCCTG